MHVFSNCPSPPNTKKASGCFSKTLLKLGFENHLLSNSDLSKKLGTSFYNIALHTKGGVLLHPGKLVRAMVDVLPSNVSLFENSNLLNWIKIKDIISCNFKNGKIKTKKIIIIIETSPLTTYW